VGFDAIFDNKQISQISAKNINFTFHQLASFKQLALFKGFLRTQLGDDGKRLIDSIKSLLYDKKQGNFRDVVEEPDLPYQRLLPSEFFNDRVLIQGIRGITYPITTRILLCNTDQKLHGNSTKDVCVAVTHHLGYGRDFLGSDSEYILDFLLNKTYRNPLTSPTINLLEREIQRIEDNRLPPLEIGTQNHRKSILVKR
jgi:hypothetical protein